MHPRGQQVSHKFFLVLKSALAASKTLASKQASALFAPQRSHTLLPAGAELDLTDTDSAPTAAVLKAATGQPYHGRSRGLGRCLLCNWAAEHGGAALDAR